MAIKIDTKLTGNTVFLLVPIPNSLKLPSLLYKKLGFI